MTLAIRRQPVLKLLIGALAVCHSIPGFCTSYLCKVYVQVIRTPLGADILFYYIIGTAWGIENRYLAGI